MQIFAQKTHSDSGNFESYQTLRVKNWKSQTPAKWVMNALTIFISNCFVQ